MRFFIATPVFNRMPALCRCVGSVNGQGHGGHGLRIRHHVQDGGSGDGALPFLADYAARQSPQSDYAMTYASESDSGMYDAINKAWDQSGEADVLSWLNADEQYLPGTLAKVKAFFDDHPAVDAVCGNYLIVDQDGGPVAARRDIPLRGIYVRNGFLYAASCTLFYRRRVQDRISMRLDTQYRYSADVDLVLRLLEAGVRFARIPDYLALFGVATGSNLSFDVEMKTESDRIKQAHGGWSSRALKRVIMGGRYAERLVHGCYRPADVAYRYALNERPDYADRRASRLTGRFTFDRFVEQERGKKS